MTTTLIPAVLTGPAAHADARAAQGPGEAPAHGPRFADVLGSQTPMGRKGDAPAQPGHDKAARNPRRAHGDKDETAADSVPAVQAQAEAALPQIALGIAAHAADAARHAQALAQGEQEQALRPAGGRDADARRAAPHSQASLAPQGAARRDASPDPALLAGGRSDAAPAAAPRPDQALSGLPQQLPKPVAGQTADARMPVAEANRPRGMRPASHDTAGRDIGKAPANDGMAAQQPAMAIVPAGKESFDAPAYTAPAADAGQTAAAGVHAGAAPAAQPLPAGHQAAALAVATPLDQAGWDADFSRQVGTLAHASLKGPQTAELRLDPPDLGPIRIAISVNDNVAHAVFVSPHAAVRQAVEQALPQLAQQLGQAGISLGDTHVGDQGRQAMFDAPPSGRQGDGGASAADGAQPAGAGEPGPRRSAMASDGLVDTFA